jgi:hypothetical protein
MVQEFAARKKSRIAAGAEACPTYFPEAQALTR